MSLSKNEGLSVCPCCGHKSLERNGGYMTCRTCGLAITTQALLRAVRHMQESTLFDSPGVGPAQSCELGRTKRIAARRIH